MKLDEIMSTSGRKKRRKRVGRGDGSGKGKTCGRGHKGYGSRSGARQRMGYEGGQTPALARLPKIGFNSFCGLTRSRSYSDSANQKTRQST